MKTETYLNLCVEQAMKSHLRYRHGAIIVRGGKVIGQGYNDYRPGFDGGALKTGRLPTHSAGGPMSKTPKKLKTKPDDVTGGGGHMVNVSLSMHSEMMAVNSALSASSTLSSSTVSSRQPYFKLSGDSKRKARLRRDAIKSYVEAVCAAAEQQYGKSQVQEWRFEGTASRPYVAEGCAPTRGYAEERAFFGNEQYGETPNKERETETTERSSSQESRWSTQQQAPAVCA